MAREKNGYIKLYSTLLEKKLSPVEFKLWVCLLLLANPPTAKEPGIVDMGLRDIAERLNMSLSSVSMARNNLLADGRIELIKVKKGKTKPVSAIKIINYQLYQHKEIVTPTEQIVTPTEQIVTPTEHSTLGSTPTIKVYKDYKDRGRKNGKHEQYIKRLGNDRKEKTRRSITGPLR